MPVAGLTPLAKFVAGTFTRPFTLRNAGDVDVYLGNDSSLTAGSRAMTLTRGATVLWSGTTELWAMSAVGDGVIEWIYEGASSVTDGATITEITGDVVLAPGSQVGIVGTVDIAGDVNLAPGAAVNINGTVPISGDVNIAGGTINVGTITGGVNVTGSTVDIGLPVKTADRTQAIYASSLPLPAGNTALASNYDVSQFSTLQLFINNDAALGIGAVATSQTVNFYWFSAAGVRLSTDRVEYSENGAMSMDIPIKGDKVTVIVTRTTTSLNVPVNLLATTRKLLRRFFHQYATIGQTFNVVGAAINSNVQGGRYFCSGTTNATPPGGTILVNNMAGEAFITVSNLSAAPVQFQMKSGSAFIARLTTPANSSGAPVPILLPELPISMLVAAINCSFEFSIISRIPS